MDAVDGLVSSLGAGVVAATEWASPSLSGLAEFMEWPSLIELLGALAGALSLYFLAREKMWAWPLELANNAFFFFLFFHAKLYADSALQVAFFVLAIHGWWRWTVSGSRDDTTLVVRPTTPFEWAVLLPAVVVGTSLLAWLLATRTDSPVPVPDALITTLSLAATYGQTRKLLESWWFWIMVDLVSIPLYASQGLLATAALHCVCATMSLGGFARWKQSYIVRTSLLPPAPINPPNLDSGRA